VFDWNNTEVQSGQGKWWMSDDVDVPRFECRYLGGEFCTGYLNNNKKRFCYQEHRGKFAITKRIIFRPSCRGDDASTCKIS
jgi:hypothetical protein